MNQNLGFLIYIAVALVLVQCNAEVQVGRLSPDSGSGSSGAAQSGQSTGSDQLSSGAASDAADEIDGAADAFDATEAPDASPLSCVYAGYIESFQFPDGSDSVTFNLSFNADGTVTGTVFLGNGPPLAPPMDPNVGYPPDVQMTGSFPDSFTAPPTDFAFTILNGSYMAPRLQLQANTSELWKGWCELQTKIYPWYNATAGTGCGPFVQYACLPNGVTMGGGVGSMCSVTPCDAMQPIQVDCLKLQLCSLSGVCTCTATSCTVPAVTMGNIVFDTQVAAGSINGSVTGLMGNQVLNVHLTRQTCVASSSDAASPAAVSDASDASADANVCGPPPPGCARAVNPATCPAGFFCDP